MNPKAKDKLEESFDPSLLNSLGIDVENIATDSRMVKPGDTFLAYVGEKIDARKFIPQAIEAGANAVLWERNGFVWNSKWGNTPNLPVSKLRAKVGAIASHVYGNPSGKLRLINDTIRLYEIMSYNHNIFRDEEHPLDCEYNDSLWIKKEWKKAEEPYFYPNQN